MTRSRSSRALPRIEPKRDNKGKPGAAYVFTTTGKTPVSGFSRAKEAIDEAILSQLRKDAEARGDDPSEVMAPARWTLHDLRRMAASGMAGIGIPPHVVEAVLNHKSGRSRALRRFTTAITTPPRSGRSTRGRGGWIRS